jgi:hypothetical protein
VPTFFSGLPVHVLVVHAVVVLVPLAALGAVLVALWPAARRQYGWLAVAVAFVATAIIPIATDTGEGLEHSLPQNLLVSAHTHLGDQLLPFAGLLLVAVAALMLVTQQANRDARQGLGRHGAGGSDPGTVATRTPTRAWVRPVAVTLSALTVAFAVIAIIQVVRIGDSGARAAWGDKQYVQQAPDAERPAG